MACSRAIALCLMLLPVAACVVPNSKIEGEDTDPLLLAGRVSVDFRRFRETPAETTVARPPRRNDFHLLLDLDAFDGEGEFTQIATTQDPISLGGPQFPVSPGVSSAVDVDFNLARVSLAVRASNRFSSGIGLDGFAGIARSDLDIELSDGVNSDRAEHVTLGPMVGATFSYSPIERLRFFIEGSVNFAVGSDVESTTISTLDFGANVILCQYAQLMAGWRKVTYESEVDDFVASDLDLELSGPVIALWFSI